MFVTIPVRGSQHCFCCYAIHCVQLIWLGLSGWGYLAGGTLGSYNVCQQISLLWCAHHDKKSSVFTFQIVHRASLHWCMSRSKEKCPEHSSRHTQMQEQSRLGLHIQTCGGVRKLAHTYLRGHRNCTCMRANTSCVLIRSTMGGHTRIEAPTCIRTPAYLLYGQGMKAVWRDV